MGIMNYGDIGSLRQAVDPAKFGADVSGTADSRAAWKRAVDYAVAMASRNGGVVHIKPAPGTYRIDWDGSTAISGLTEGYNTRYILGFPSTAEHVWLDFHGVKVLQGGVDYSELSNVFFLDQQKSVRLRGGEFDFVNQPFFWGEVTAIGADYFDMDIDSDCETPQFTTAFQVCTHLTSVASRSHLMPIAYGIARQQGTDSAFSVTAQGGGSYRIGGLTGTDLTNMTAQGIIVGAVVSVRAIRDGAKWFLGRKVQSWDAEGYKCFTGGDGFSEMILSRNLREANGYQGPRMRADQPNLRQLVSLTRGGTNWHWVGGKCSIEKVEYIHHVDDPIAVGMPCLSRMVAISGTSFDAFMPPHWWGAYLDAGDKLIICDDDGNEACRCTITAVEAPGTPDATYPPRKFTVTVDSGSMPGDLTSHYAEVITYDLDLTLDNPGIERVGGRGIYCGGPVTMHSPRVNLCGAQGICVDLRPADLRHYNYRDIVINTPKVSNSCLNTTANGAIVVRKHRYGDDDVAATGYPIKRLLIVAPQIYNTSNAAIIVQAVENGDIIAPQIDGVAGTGASVDEAGTGLNATVFGATNCKNVRFVGGRISNFNGADILKTTTQGGGSNVNVYEENNDTDTGSTVHRVTRILDISGAAAGRIKFPATQVPSADANTLDDYEEGTWTPGLTINASATGISLTSVGEYTKIGNQVTVTGRITLSSKGASVGSVLITGLPFTATASYRPIGSAAGLNMSSLVDGLSIDAEASTTTANLYTGSSSGVTALTNSNLSDTSVIRFTLTYKV